MKTLTGKTWVWPALIIFGLILLPGCSKDRTEPANEKKSYSEMDNYYDSKKQQEQEYEITEDGKGPLTGKQGTKVYPDKNKLMYPNGDSVNYPYTVKLVELYSAKDMIYWQMPTVSEGKVLTSAGEVRIRAFKDDVELVLRPGLTWTVEVPSANPVSDMKIFYGDKMEPVVDWSPNPEGAFSSVSEGYHGEIAKLGWIACSKFIAEPATFTKCTFTSSTDNLDQAGIFIYFPQLRGLVQVFNQQSIDLPAGEEAKIVVMAINSDQQLFSYSKVMQIGESDMIQVELDSTSDAELTAILDAL